MLCAWWSICCCSTPAQGADDVAAITIIHGTNGKGFPWPSALRYRFNIAQPTTCTYSISASFAGKVAAIQSPAAFEGTVLDLVMDALLGRPTEDVDFYLNCTALDGQKRESTGGAPGTRPFPGMSAPDKFKWNQPHRPAVHSDAHIEHARWRGDDDELGNDDDERPYQSDPRHYRNPGHHGAHHHHSHQDPKHAPNQPPKPSVLVQSNNYSVFQMELATDDVNLSGALSGAAFSSWSELLRQPCQGYQRQCLS